MIQKWFAMENSASFYIYVLSPNTLLAVHYYVSQFVCENFTGLVIFMLVTI